MSNISNQIENEILGLLVEYDDDIDSCIKQPIKQKSRVKYNCFHAYGSFLAFGSSSGAIYLFKLEAITHSTCSLITIIPCDQGPIEVIQFSPYSSSENLLVTIGTARGSFVVFKLTILPSEQDLICEEIYRAESFTPSPIELIEHDIDVTSTFRIYLCDANNHIYLVDNFIEPRIRQLFYTKAPTLLLKIDDSKVNQLSVFRSQLLISTSKSTILFDADTNEFQPVGKKKRKDEGYYGGCFFTSLTKNNFNTNSSDNHQRASNNTYLDNNGDSMISLADNVTIYAARPSFRLWQVNLDGSVLFTHQFESAIRSSFVRNIVKLKNSPLQEDQLDDPSDILFNLVQNKQMTPGSDHFQRLIQLYSSTLGQCLLTHTKDEIFILDPNGAKLIVWNTQELSNIRRICCVDNEIYILCDNKPTSTATTNANLHSNDPIGSSGSNSKRKNINFHLKRLVLLAPTQYVLELHRLHRYDSLIVFVESYIDLFKNKMALPLGGDYVITTEGGLLRNVLLNAWTIFVEEKKDSHSIFGSMIELILDEGRQMQQVETFVSNLSLFSIPSVENINRLRQEPYASLISLNVSIADLHTSHVIHFSKETINRYNSTNQIQDESSKSNLDLGPNHRLGREKVIVERRRPKRAKSHYRINEISLQDRAGSISCLHSSGNFNENSKLLARIPSKDYLYQEEESMKNNEKMEFETKNGKQKRSLLKQIPETIGETNTHKSQCGDLLSNSTEVPTRDEEINNTITKPLSTASKDLIHYVETIATRKLLPSVYCCKECGWPLPNSHHNLHSLQESLDSWIDRNLMGELETNIAYIEDLAFTNCLWKTYLKCLIHKKKYGVYVKCSILLDDIRLMQNESITSYMASESAISSVLELLMKKYEFSKFRNHELEKEETNNSLKCLNCDANLELDHKYDESLAKFNISLVNIAEISMNCIGPRATIDILLKEQFKELVEGSRIPASFYIQAIKAAALSAHQSPISRTRLAILRGSVDESFDVGSYVVSK